MIVFSMLPIVENCIKVNSISALRYSVNILVELFKFKTEDYFVELCEQATPTLKWIQRNLVLGNLDTSSVYSFLAKLYLTIYDGTTKGNL